jgi:hypothetical protein
MENPFATIEQRLTTIERMITDLRIENQQKTAEPELIRRKEARELLGGISDPTIISYERRGLIKPVRIGGTILYNKAEILAHKK